MAKIDKSKMKCNKPRRTPDGPKKFVVKACEGGTEKIIRYGDPKMTIKKSNPNQTPVSYTHLTLPTIYSV